MSLRHLRKTSPLDHQEMVGCITHLSRCEVAKISPPWPHVDTAGGAAMSGQDSKAIGVRDFFASIVVAVLSAAVGNLRGQHS
jgi:hypothetical protein